MGPGGACATVIVECHRCGFRIKKNLTHVGENQPGLLGGWRRGGQWCVFCISNAYIIDDADFGC